MDDRRRPVRSYVLRQGRMTPGQEKAYENHIGRFGTGSGPFTVDSVFSRDAPLVLEIGFGMGDSLYDMATANPSLNFVGVEVHKPGVGHLLTRLGSDDPGNLRVCHGDVQDFLARLAPASLARVQVYFPDPWPKKKHHKRRLLQPAFFDQLAVLLEPKGVLHFATDWEPYAEAVVETLAGDARFSAVTPPARPETKYERRGTRLGHVVSDLAWELESP